MIETEGVRCQLGGRRGVNVICVNLCPKFVSYRPTLVSLGPNVDPVVAYVQHMTRPIVVLTQHFAIRNSIFVDDMKVSFCKPARQIQASWHHLVKLQPNGMGFAT